MDSSVARCEADDIPARFEVRDMPQTDLVTTFTDRLDHLLDEHEAGKR